ncbi:hypothetical protein [Stenotrophomonas sp.]|uniref:hypothetical protein n=1 Tax=Stenotrophomonas sp. TaxID=69392 RepID=UPI00289A4338|nr:hypothetical protein [Stenotrophomonas sp.]
MSIKFNADVVGEIVRADLRNAPAEEMRELYIRRNILDIDPDATIYRIVQLQYFIEDLVDRRMTYTNIDKDTWGDKSENPLLGRSFVLPDTGEALDLDDLVANTYGSCWSATALDTHRWWARFSRSQPSVRLQSTPRKLLNSVMNTEQRFYMQHHAIGRMVYVPDERIEGEFADTNWQKHLDSLGQGIASSFLRLSDNLSDEDEVRLIYDDSRDPWAVLHVQLTNRFAKVPFDFQTAIDALVIGPLVSECGAAELRTKLELAKLNCPVSNSVLRLAVD